MTLALHNFDFTSHDGNFDSSIDIYARVLQPKDRYDLRSLRLEALRLDGRYYATSIEIEKNFPDEHWRTLCTDSKDHCVIGIFNALELMGLTMILTWEEDASGKTALLGRSYIKQAYRQKGFSSLLYGARLGWCRKELHFDSAVVFHRKGNVVSKKINERFGARYWTTRPMQWADGETDDALWYRVELGIPAGDGRK